MVKELKDLIADSRKILKKNWDEVVLHFDDRKIENYIDDENILESIKNLINSKTKTYRYVLPTQIIAKAADHSLDSRCLQANRDASGSFDARSVCHSVIVPFEKEQENVLGGSPEPYVNNPLRQPEISVKYKHKQKNKKGWDNLCSVLEGIEAKDDPIFTQKILKQVYLFY